MSDNGYPADYPADPMTGDLIDVPGRAVVWDPTDYGAPVSIEEQAGDYSRPSLAGDTTEPTAWIGGVTGAVTIIVAGILNVLQLLEVIDLTADTLAALNTYVGAVVGAIGTIVAIVMVRNRVKPMADLIDHG